MRLNRTVLALVVLIASMLPLSAAEPVRTTLTLLLVSDLYGLKENAEGRGGLARLAAVVKRERAARANLIVVHAGDAISPSLLSGFDRGAHMIELLSDIGFDVFVPGNHEFDFGPEVFLERLKEARFPVIAGNLLGGDGKPVPGVAPTRMFDLGGLMVGVAGFITETTAQSSSPSPMQFTPVLDGALDAEAALRKAGADLVVQVVHTPRSVDLELIAEQAGDVILSGHDHDLLVAYDSVTAFAESMHDALYAVAVDLDVTVTDVNGRRTVSWWPRFRIIDTADVTPDPGMTAKVAAVEARLDASLDEPVAVLVAPLDIRETLVRGGEAAIGDLFADALRQRMKADAALLNGGGIRSDTVLPAGHDLTRRDILTALPFGNTAVTLSLDGRTLRAALEQGLSDAQNLTGAFPQVSGITLKADLSRPPGDRIVAMTVAGKPLDEAATYTLATTDYLANGGDGYIALKSARTLIAAEDGPLLATVVIDALSAMKTIDARTDSRLVIARDRPPR
jgi:5'-nucleotidase / UDP-sugar diphosphatase